MGISFVQTSVSFLAVWTQKAVRMLVRSICFNGWGTFAKAAFCACFCVASGYTTSVTINGPTALQADIINLATTTYNATVTPSTFFSGSYTINLISKKLSPPVIACPPSTACELDKDLALVVAASSWSYVNGFANGQDYQRNGDLAIAGVEYSACASTDTCTAGTARIANRIYQQGVDTPTVINAP